VDATVVFHKIFYAGPVIYSEYTKIHLEHLSVSAVSSNRVR